MAFQTRHYQAIAAEFQAILRRTNGKVARATTQQIIEDFADMFGRDNFDFKRDLFLAACEPGANVNARTAEGARARKWLPGEWREPSRRKPRRITQAD